MRIVLDIETNLAHDKIHLVVTKDIDTGEVKSWKAATGLNDYLSKATLLIGHNIIGFDAPTLNRTWQTKIRLKNVYDTLIVSRLLDPSRETGHGLEAWGNTLGFHKIDYTAVWQWMMDRKEEYKGECFDKPIDSLLEHYCVRDVEVTAKLYHHLEDKLKDFYVEYNDELFPEKKGIINREAIDLEHRVAKIIAQQERNGFKLDQIYATCLLTDIKSKVAGIYERMQQRWPPVTVERISDKTGKRLKDSVVTFNPGSRQQIAQKLIEMGWKPKKFTDKGQVMIDESILDEIIKET